MQYSDTRVQYVGALGRPHLQIGPTYIGPNTLCDVCTTILTDLLNNTRCTFESAYACLHSIHPLTHSHFSLSTLFSSVLSLRARVCVPDTHLPAHHHIFTLTCLSVPLLFLCLYLFLCSPTMSSSPKLLAVINAMNLGLRVSLLLLIRCCLSD